MTPLGETIPSPCCGADWRLVNPGAWSPVHAVGVVACAAGCGREYGVRVDVTLVAGLPVGAKVRPSPEDVDDRAARARQLVADGRSVSDVCRVVGIDRGSYYNRLRVTR